MSFRIVGKPEVQLVGCLPLIAGFGPDQVLAFSQGLVGNDLGVHDMEEALGLEAAQAVRKIKESDPDATEGWGWDELLNEASFKKHLSGIGRGHAVDGLPVVAFTIAGSKMLDSALTGMVYSRSLASSSRRKQSTLDDLYVPLNIQRNTALFEAYKEVNRTVFDAQPEFAKLGKEALATFNKLRPYNERCEMLHVVPLSSLVNLAQAVDLGEAASIDGDTILPEELHAFVKMLPGLLDSVDMGQMFRIRKAVPRENYAHYTVFTNPHKPNWVQQSIDEGTDKNGPKLMVDISAYAALHAKDLVEDMCDRIKQAGSNAQCLYEAVKANARELSHFCRAFNEAVMAQTHSKLSWRVWSEQKRHGTLKQQVISVYAAAMHAIGQLEGLLDNLGDSPREYTAVELAKVMTLFRIDPVLHNHPALLNLYVYLTLRQMQLCRDVVKECYYSVWGGSDVSASEAPVKKMLLRDALYCVPRNILLDTIETYDMLNLFSLELPLRLCSTCEVERRSTSEYKAQKLKHAMPQSFSYLLEPKCNLGYCPEAKFCMNVLRFNPNYNQELHEGVAKLIAAAGRGEEA